MKKWKNASYTVEAALLMGIIIPLCVGIIYLSFYIHNRVYLQSTAYEMAATASLFQGESDNAKWVAAKKDFRTKGCLFGIRGLKTKEQLGKKEVQVEMSGEFAFPEFVSGFSSEWMKKITVGVHTKLAEPSKTIRKIHGVKKWAKGGAPD